MEVQIVLDEEGKVTTVLDSRGQQVKFSLKKLVNASPPPVAEKWIWSVPNIAERFKQDDPPYEDGDEDDEGYAQKLSCAQCDKSIESKQTIESCAGCSKMRYCDTVCARKHWNLGHCMECLPVTSNSKTDPDIVLRKARPE